MTEKNTVIAHYNSLFPTQFCIVRNIEFKQTSIDGIWDSLLSIELAPESEADTRKLLLSFSGVRGLKYIPASWSVLRFTYIEVIPLESDQLDGINYHVFESEQDTEFSLLCREFKAELLVR